MSINNMNPDFYSSSIVGDIIPIAIGVSQAIKLNKLNKNVWCFIGDMSYDPDLLSP